MPYEDKMTIDERRKYLQRMKKRYDEADRKGKGELLDEMERYTDLHRQSLIRLMNGALHRKPRCRERGRTYGPEVDDALRIIAESRDDICAERLQPTLAKMARHLAAHGELETTPELLNQLGRISVSTVRRSLNHSRQDQCRLPQRTGRKPNKVLQQVPMVRIPWDEQEPGHFEVDLVHHSGPITSGDYICSLQMIDVATGWSERRAVLGRSYLVMEDAFRRILAFQYLLTHIPFPVLEVHPDNDSAFFNQHMFRFWGDKVADAHLSRSRPYHKNDNRFVEQKNSTLIRAYLGDVRLDTVAQTWALNHLYERMWRYYNFFQPVMRLKEKIVIPGTDGQPARVKKKYDEAHTPFERLVATNVLTPERQAQMETMYEQTNPCQLRREIYDRLEYIFALDGAVPGVAQNIYLTLRTSPLRELLDDGVPNCGTGP
jgi:hypothetical protein